MSFKSFSSAKSAQSTTKPEDKKAAPVVDPDKKPTVEAPSHKS